MESKVVAPAQGKKITLQDGKLNIPENPIIPYIEGDGIDVDVTLTMLKAVDVAIKRAYKGEHKIPWMEIYTGGESTQACDQGVWLPAGTLGLIREYRVAIKGPLTTPVGGGIRSLNVALRQELDLYVCLHPVRYYRGTPSPVKHPELTDMAIFRENSEDVCTGIEQKVDSTDAEKVIRFLCEEMDVEKIRFPKHYGIGTKPYSKEGTKHLVRAAIEYAIANDRDSVTLVHRDNIMKFTEGASKNWGYQLAREEFGGGLIGGGPQLEVKSPNTGKETVIKDMIADTFLQRILLRPAEYDVIACMNLNSDYISDTLVAQIGGTGIVPGADIGGECALLEATCGTAPKYAGQDKVNPDSIILSAEMMLRHMDWTEATDLIVKGVEGIINARAVIYGFERLMEGAKLLKCSEFGDAIIKNMQLPHVLNTIADV